MSDEFEYPFVALETVRKIRQVKRANRNENLIDLPESELKKVGIAPGDPVDVKAHTETGEIRIRKLVPASSVTELESIDKSYVPYRRNSPRPNQLSS